MIAYTGGGNLLRFAREYRKNGGKTMRVLIVDDEEMIRNVLKEYVEFEGNEAFEAVDGFRPSKCARKTITTSS